MPLNRDARLQIVSNYTNIINFDVDDKEYHDTQASRVEPNKRLKTVFGIDNAFTNPNRIYITG
jgi:hypothetical protein